MPKDEYQDLYMVMRDRFKDIADSWHEATDASKHVFEVSAPSNFGSSEALSRCIALGYIHRNLPDVAVEAHLPRSRRIFNL